MNSTHAQIEELDSSRLQLAQTLSRMEKDCLALVADGLSSKQISSVLGIAKTSVDTYCDRAREKLDVADRFEAARYVRRDPPAPPSPISLGFSRARSRLCDALLMIALVMTVFSGAVIAMIFITDAKPPTPAYR